MSQNMMSVSSLNIKIKSLLEATFMHTMVEGEVASATYHTSGHLYFSIKDKDSSIKCVMWRSSVAKMKFRIEKGMHIVVEGSVSVYTPRGEYQFQTVRIEPYGKGALALAFEQLKEKLKSKGYFDAQRKKEIPKHIQKIALVTAKDSAALHDMLKIIEKRWAMVEVTIVDTLVQGEQAAVKIAKSLRYADSIGMDVVVVGRGGGSAEDLWSFNEEVVADAIFTMKTPVVSAVGHEVDVMISDFVADLRAPTPSAAMEMILSDSTEILYLLSEMNERISYTIKQKIQKLVYELQHAKEMLVRTSPSQKLGDTNQRFTQHLDEFKRVLEYKMEHFTSSPSELAIRYSQAISIRLRDKQHFLDLVAEKLKMNDPKLQCHDGWAQVSYKGKVVGLSDIEIGKNFILEDEKMQIEALCVNSKIVKV
jgi:exodeoxyribonuclease VII large subunit